MMIIKTKRHKLKFYGLIAFAFMFFSAMGVLLAFNSLDLLNNGQPSSNDFFLPLFSLLLFGMAFYSVYAYWKNSPIISVDSNTIRFGNQILDFKDIVDVALTGKMPFRYIIKFPMEGTAILFKDGTEKFFYDDMYSNSWELKTFLEQTIVNKGEYVPYQTQKIDNNVIRFEKEETFKGNQFTSFRGILLWGLIGFFIFLIISKNKTPPVGFLIFFGVFGTFWFLLHSWCMHYFSLTNDYLIVRNHNFVWMTKIYKLNDIKEIVYETQGKQPNSMRVITKDFKNKLYPAGTLRDKTWLELKKKLEDKRVAVRNECIF